MNYLNLNVAFGISKSSSSYFVEYIRVNDKEKVSSKFLFTYDCKPAFKHPLVFEKIVKSKGKQEVYLTLTGDSLVTYFSVSRQKFRFNGNDLEETSKASQFYSYLQDPASFINKFNQEFKKANDSVKLKNLLNRIENTADKNEILKICGTGYDNLASNFISYFKIKYDKKGKSLFDFKDTSDLNKFMQTKIDFYTNFTESSFKDSLLQILYFLNDDQRNFIEKWNPSTYEDLINLTKVYTDHIQASSNAFVGCVQITPQVHLESIGSYSSLPGYDTLMQLEESTCSYNKLNDLNCNILKEKWMDALNLTTTQLEDEKALNDKAVSNGVFVENVESIVNNVKNLNPASILKSLPDNEKDQLQTNSIDSTNKKTELNPTDPTDSTQIKFNNHDYVIDQSTKLPIIQFKETYPVKDKQELNDKNKKEICNKRKQNLDSTYYMPAPKKRYISINPKKNLRERKDVDYKEPSTDESMENNRSNDDTIST